MTKFAKLIAPALAVGLAMTVAVPAQANYYDDPRQIRAELRQFDRQLDRASQNRSVSPRNATWLSYRLQGVRQQMKRFRRGGFTDWEMSTLNHSVEILHHELDRRSIRNGRYNARYDGRGVHRNDRGYNNRYDRGNDYRQGRGSRDDRRYRRGSRRDD